MTNKEAIELVDVAFGAWESEYSTIGEDWSKEHEARDMAIKALEQKPRVDFKELKRKILMEVDGGTDDVWLAYGEVCNRISNSIDEFVADMRGEEE